MEHMSAMLYAPPPCAEFALIVVVLSFQSESEQRATAVIVVKCTSRQAGSGTRSAEEVPEDKLASALGGCHGAHGPVRDAFGILSG